MELQEATAKVKKEIGPKVRKCYESSEAIYHLAGGKQAGLKPMQMMHEGISHWFLEASDGTVIDITADQFKTTPEYNRGCGRGFLTKKPSKKASKIMIKILGA